MAVIQLEQVGKQYWIRHQAPERRLMEVLHDTALASLNLLRGRRSAAPPSREEFWALRDVSLKIDAGEVVGLIGRNGAGKSTLLKLISWIMAPTTGRIGVRGRLGCLLEVGSGFHPELTGRENVFLNGAILGMSLREIRSKFDEIVAFSEVEAFLDMPVKHYSSGMFVRLAFAVAAFLDPEILIVDEVLAVGDSAFQRKCLNAIRDSVRRGRTCILVSHHLPSITSLCQRALLLQQGYLVADGAPEDVVRQYLESARLGTGEQTWPDDDTAPGCGEVRLRAVRLLQDHGRQSVSDVELDSDLLVEIDYHLHQPLPDVTVSLLLKDSSGLAVLMSSSAESAILNPESTAHAPASGAYRARCCIPAWLLNEGRYSVSVTIGLGVHHPLASAEDAVMFHTHDVGELRMLHAGTWPGAVRPRLRWQVESAELRED